MHKDLLDIVYKNGNTEDMQKLGELFNEMLNFIYDTDIVYYNKLYLCIYKMGHGEHLDENLAKKWVDTMINKDGSKGAHWSITETDEVAKHLNITFDKYNRYEFWVIMNMMYSDYYGAVANEVITYGELAKNWLTDVDAKEGKVFRYYEYIVK